MKCKICMENHSLLYYVLVWFGYEAGSPIKFGTCKKCSKKHIEKEKDELK